MRRREHKGMVFFNNVELKNKVDKENKKLEYIALAFILICVSACVFLSWYAFIH